jgi:hypothetical protein
VVTTNDACVPYSGSSVQLWLISSDAIPKPSRLGLLNYFVIIAGIQLVAIIIVTNTSSQAHEILLGFCSRFVPQQNSRP